MIDPELKVFIHKKTCLAVLNFIDRDYDAAVEFFKSSLKADPSNYSLWNKLGIIFILRSYTCSFRPSYRGNLSLP